MRWTRCSQDQTKWHEWYAWYPLYEIYFCGNKRCAKWVWFEKVWRRMAYGYDGGDWEYRFEEPQCD